MPIDVKLVYQANKKEKLKYQALVDALNRQRGFFGYFAGTPPATVDKESDTKVTIALSFNDEEAKKAFFRKQEANLPRGATLSPNLNLVYQNTEKEKLKYQALMKALNRQVGFFSYFFSYFLGNRRATADEVNDTTIMIALSFDDEEERKTFLQEQEANLPRGVTLPPNLNLVYPNNEKEKLKYQALMKALNRQVGFFSYFLGNRRATADEVNDTEVMIALSFNDEEEKKAFLQEQKANLPPGVTLPPNVNLVYQNTEKEKLKYQALMKALNRQVGFFGYWLGSQRATADGVNGKKVTIALSFNDEEEKKAFLREQKDNLPRGITLSPDGEIQGDIEGVILSPQGEIQKAIKGVALPPDRKIQEVIEQAQEQEQEQEQDDDNEYQDVLNENQPAEHRYEDLPLGVQEDIEKARKKAASSDEGEEEYYDTKDEIEHESYSDRLNRSINPYLDACNKFTTAKKAGVLTPEEEANVRKQGYSASDQKTFLDAIEGAREIATGDDKVHLKQMKSATEELDGSVESTKAWMKSIKTSFNPLSKIVQAYLIEPVCNLCKAIGNGFYNLYRGAGEFIGFFSKKRDTLHTEGEGHKKDADGPTTFGSE